jgi:hypothetical protein
MNDAGSRRWRTIVAIFVLSSLCGCHANPEPGQDSSSKSPSKGEEVPTGTTHRSKYFFDKRFYVARLRCEEGEAISASVALAAMQTVRAEVAFCLHDPAVGTRDVSPAAPVWTYGQWREGIGRGHWQFVRATSELTYGGWQTRGGWYGHEPKAADYAGTLACSDHTWTVQSHRYMCKTF